MSCRLVTGIGLRDGAAGAACELTTGGDHPPGRLDGRTLWPGMATRLRRDVWVEQCEERGVRGVRLVALGDRRGGQVRPLWGLHLEGEKVCVKSKSLALDNRTESLWPFLSSAKCLEVPAQVWGRLRPTFFAENFQWTSEKKEIKWMFSRFINGINKFNEWQSSSFF